MYVKHKNLHGIDFVHDFIVNANDIKLKSMHVKHF